MRNSEKGVNKAAGPGRTIALTVLIFLITLSLGACKKAGNGDGDGMDIVVDGGNGESSDSGPDTGPDPDPGADGSGDGSGTSGSGDTPYDQSVFPLKENFKPAYPEYADSVEWFEVPKDYIGGLGESVEPDPGVETYVNIREKPTLSAKVVGELHKGDQENIWWCVNDMYQENGVIHVGYYKVKADDYTWRPVKNDRTGVSGWVALELVQLFAI